MKSTLNSTPSSSSTIKRKPFIVAFLFYFLIAFEFAYMAGPFAAFFYSAYSPALNFFNNIEPLSWLIQFFLPHVTQSSSSALISSHNVIGAILALGGFLMFVIGACRIYYSKLAKKGAVTGGMYKYIRHPQYISFIICSLGLLLIWPRYIVLIGFVTMLFVYYYLARAEETECIEKFGETYITYMENTNMFIPFIKFPRKKSSFPKPSLIKRFIAALFAYLITLASFLGIAYGLQILTINSLHAQYTDTSATIAICELDHSTISEITEIVFKNENVQAELGDSMPSTYYLNYILPTTWFAAEVPMNGLTYRAGHKSDSNYDATQYKCIITRAIPRNDSFTSGKSILTQLHSRQPLLEVWVDTSTHQVTQILQMPDEIKYDGIPEAIY